MPPTAPEAPTITQADLAGHLDNALWLLRDWLKSGDDPEEAPPICNATAATLQAHGLGTWDETAQQHINRLLKRYPATVACLEATDRQAEEDRETGKAFRQALAAISLRAAGGALDLRPAPSYAAAAGDHYRASVISQDDGAMLFGSYAPTPAEALRLLTEAMHVPRESVSPRRSTSCSSTATPAAEDIRTLKEIAQRALWVRACSSHLKPSTDSAAWALVDLGKALDKLPPELGREVSESDFLP
jgi:hypothetical protein